MIKMRSFEDAKAMLALVILAIVLSIMIGAIVDALEFGKGFATLMCGLIWVLVVVGFVRNYQN